MKRSTKGLKVTNVSTGFFDTRHYSSLNILLWKTNNKFSLLAIAATSSKVDQSNHLEMASKVFTLSLAQFFIRESWLVLKSFFHHVPLLSVKCLLSFANASCNKAHIKRYLRSFLINVRWITQIITACIFVFGIFCPCPEIRKITSGMHMKKSWWCRWRSSFFYNYLLLSNLLYLQAAQ